MLRPKAQMVCENVGSFQYLMYKRHYKKKKSGPEKKIEGSKFFIQYQGSKWPLHILPYFHLMVMCYPVMHYSSTVCLFLQPLAGTAV